MKHNIFTQAGLLAFIASGLAYYLIDPSYGFNVMAASLAAAAAIPLMLLGHTIGGTQ